MSVSVVHGTIETKIFNKSNTLYVLRWDVVSISLHDWQFVAHCASSINGAYEYYAKKQTLVSSLQRAKSLNISKAVFF